jgi:cyclic pyranopterin phosphate synthase
MNSNGDSRAMKDTLGRPLRDLRISVIDMCNLRCTYCMPADEYHEGYAFLRDEERLSFDEIVRLATLFVEFGVSKLRITGGEPLLRKDMDQLVAKLATLEGVDDLALTTNALLLPQYAESLRKAGLQRMTVSLDTLDKEVFGKMNGRGKAIQPVLDGISAAQASGFGPIKINVVVQRGVNDHTVLDLVEFCKVAGHIPRFIEYMDVGNRNRWEADHVVPNREILDAIHARWPVEPQDRNYHGEVASRYAFSDGSGEIGFISSVTEPFCGTCTRARLSADGQFVTCLFADAGLDLRGPMRAGATDDELRELVRGVWERRTDRYSELRSQLRAEQEPGRRIEMYQIGG